MADGKGVADKFARGRAKAETPAEDDPYLKTTIFLRGSNWRALRAEALHEGVSASAIVAALVEQYLTLDAAGKRATLDAARRIRSK